MKHVRNIIICAVVIAAVSASAELVTEYFQYGGTYGVPLTSLTTADTAGWGANGWTFVSGIQPHYTNWVVAFSSAYGEANSYVNSNHLGSLIGNPAGNNAGIITRSFSPALDGTIWVSMTFTNTRTSATPNLQYANLRINNSASDYISIASSGYLERHWWSVIENNAGVTGTIYTLSGVGNFGGGLLVARLRTNYDSTYDDITLWLFTNKCDKLNGRTVAALGTELYQSDDAQDIWGDSISSLGIDIRKANVAGRELVVDSLRISKGNIADDEHVYEILTGVPVPEPELIGLAALALVAVRRK